MEEFHGGGNVSSVHDYDGFRMKTLSAQLACALPVALKYNMFAIDGTLTLPRGTLPEDYLALLVENGSMVEDAFDLQFRQQPDVCGRIPENQFQAFAAESKQLFMATLKRAQSERCIRRLFLRVFSIDASGCANHHGGIPLALGHNSPRMFQPQRPHLPREGIPEGRGILRRNAQARESVFRPV